MNLRKQVEPLLSTALQASSKQRHAQRATSRLAWVVTLAQTSLRETITSKAGAGGILACEPGLVKACNGLIRRGLPGSSRLNSQKATLAGRSERGLRWTHWIAIPRVDCGGGTEPVRPAA